MPTAPIIVATDLSPRSDRAVDRAFHLGRQLSLPVKVVHVLSAEEHAGIDQGQLMGSVKSVLPDPEADVEILLPVGSPPQTIAKTAEVDGAQLVVVGPARFNQLGDYFLGTAIDYLVRHSKVPVLVVKQRPHCPYRRILFPSDFSDTSKSALLRIAQLFPDAQLHVVHAFHVPFEGWQKADYVKDETREEHQAELDLFLGDSEIGAVVGDRVQGQLGYGEIGRVVLDSIKTLVPDLVALGTHGSSGFRHATIGSNANAMLNWLEVDTLMVPVHYS